MPSRHEEIERDLGRGCITRRKAPKHEKSPAQEALTQIDYGLANAEEGIKRARRGLKKLQELLLDRVMKITGENDNGIL